MSHLNWILQDWQNVLVMMMMLKIATKIPLLILYVSNIADDFHGELLLAVQCTSYFSLPLITFTIHCLKS